MHTRRRRVLEHLITRGVLSEAQVAHAQQAREVPTRARPSDVVNALAAHCGVPAVDVRFAEISPALWRLLPFELAARYVFAPLSQDGVRLRLAMADPTQPFAVDDVKFLTGLDVDVVVADEEDLRALIAAQHARLCPGAPSPFDALAQPEEDAAKLVSALLAQAATRGARELLLEPRSDVLVVSLFLGRDAQPEEMMRLPPEVATELAALQRGRGAPRKLGDIDIDARFYSTRFGTELSLRLFGPDPVPLLSDECVALPCFADAARIEPGATHGRVDLHTANGWRPTWTYPMVRHARLVAAAYEIADVDVSDDECANGVRLFLRKRS